LSNADFSDWPGWTVVGDDMDDHDSRCNSAIIHTMLKPEYGENTEDRRHAASQLLWQRNSGNKVVGLIG